MKIKVCGMKYAENIRELSQLSIDWMGMIFYPKSPRYANDLDASMLSLLPNATIKVGVFVNEEIEKLLETVRKYSLDMVQLHGSESVEYCQRLKCSRSNLSIIKAFNVDREFNFDAVKPYAEVCDYFLFDTKTPQYGGSGVKFDWSILDAYTGDIPFLLSGGISAKDVESVKAIVHPRFAGIDLNSKFEVEPGMKNIEELKLFIKQFRNE